MGFNIPKIVKDAERLMGEIEIAVTRFPRAHRYTLGADLRGQVMQIARLTHLAWRDRSNRAERLKALDEAIADMKLRMQLGQQVHAFASFRQFETLGRLVTDLGRQCGGWQQRRNASGQNGTASAPVQRPQILSSHAASSEARS
jgi:hypothetical protein